MRILAISTLKRFYQQPKYRSSEEPLRAWISLAKAARWAHPVDVKSDCNSADNLGDGRMVFDIGGNKYRLVVRFDFRYGMAYIRFIGTHAEYDRIDARTV